MKAAAEAGAESVLESPALQEMLKVLKISPIKNFVYALEQIPRLSANFAPQRGWASLFFKDLYNRFV
jgi:hypothetical protein